MSDGKPYLRPAGLVWGRDAREAVGSGRAGWLAGGPVAFTQASMTFRHETLVSRSWHDYAELAESPYDAVRALIDRITAPRPSLPGLESAGPAIMGIVNVTPDSFSDGGQAETHDAAIAQGRALAAAGASILDIGGESTRPGSDPVGLNQELDRVMPVIEALVGDGHVVSVDTRKAEVMRQALAAGAKFINDVSALTFDDDSVDVARASACPAILMHAQGDPKTMQKNPVYDDVALDVFDALETWLESYQKRGIGRENLLTDPGIGFGKTFHHNLELVQKLSLFHGLGVPLVFGASRKAFIGALTGEKQAGKRVNGSIGLALAAAMQGAQIIRVHDVRQTVEALTVFRAGLDPDSAAI